MFCAFNCTNYLSNLYILHQFMIHRYNCHHEQQKLIKRKVSQFTHFLRIEKVILANILRITLFSTFSTDEAKIAKLSLHLDKI